MKIRPSGAAFHDDGRSDIRTNVTKLVAACLYLANALKTEDKIS